MKIWKYSLAFTDTQVIKMPSVSEIIHFDNQNEVPTLWVLVEPSEDESCKRTIRIVGTNHEITEDRVDLRFLGTAIFGSGAIVFHAFEVFENE